MVMFRAITGALLCYDLWTNISNGGKRVREYRLYNFK